MSRDALIVGINTYSQLRDLRAPATDAEAIAQRLQQNGDFQTIRRLPEALTEANGHQQATIAKTVPVTRQQLKAALKQLFQPNSSQAPDTALFYFSGHGLPDADGYDKGYLATSDTDPENPELGISLGWLHWLLANSPVRQQVVWLDCCHSGALVVNVQAANPGHAGQKNRCFIAASREFESAWQDLNSPYSVLTKALLDGLQSQAGHWVSSYDLVAQIDRALQGELQKPVCTNFGEAINLILPHPAAPETQLSKLATADICPYKGLEYFDYGNSDPQYFFGREQLTGQLVDQVRTQNFLALVGASGNGKSSVLRAGLLHQLQLGRPIMGSDQWRLRVTRPDQQPLRNLALAFVDGQTPLERATQLGQAEDLLQAGADGLRRLVAADAAPRVILVVDQFEEVFTRCNDRQEREQFFATLMGALAENDPKLCLIIAMRADFIGKCLERDYSGLARAIEQHMVSVLPLNEGELRDAIGQPAEQVGQQVEPALVEDILKDIADAPGSLPLLQYTLTALWNQPQGPQLTLAAYRALGGITGTLDQRATQLYDEFSPAEQQTVQHIFQQLTQLGEGTEDTRRRVFLENLVAEPLHPAGRVRSVVERLAARENRLLVTSEVVSKGETVRAERSRSPVTLAIPAGGDATQTTPLNLRQTDQERFAIVDVAHEALIRHWRLLRGWVEQNRDLLRQQRRIEASAVRWQEQGKAKGYLLQGFPLKEALQFQKQQGASFPLSEVAKGFVRRSVRQQWRDRVKVAIWLLIPAMIVVALVEHNIRAARVRELFARLDRDGGYEEMKAIEALVAGCLFQEKYGGILKYPIVRIFGHCEGLYRAPLERAQLAGSNLWEVNLVAANLQGADLRQAKLGGANLQQANLRGADLRMAYLGGDTITLYRRSKLWTFNLGKTNLQGANLQASNLKGTQFGGVNLGQANFQEADLEGAYLGSTYLGGAYFGEANLQGVDLRGAILLATDLRESRNLKSTQFKVENPPLLCNVALPANLQNVGLDPYRDCEQMPQVLVDQHGWTLERAQQYFEEIRQVEFE